MPDLEGQIGQLRFTVNITRKDGQTQTVELVGFIDEKQLQEFTHERHPFDSSPERGD